MDLPPAISISMKIIRLQCPLDWGGTKAFNKKVHVKRYLHWKYSFILTTYKCIDICIHMHLWMIYLVYRNTKPGYYFVNQSIASSYVYDVLWQWLLVTTVLKSPTIHFLPSIFSFFRQYCGHLQQWQMEMDAHQNKFWIANQYFSGSANRWLGHVTP